MLNLGFHNKKKKKSDNIVSKGYYIHITSTNTLKEGRRTFGNEMALKLIFFHNEKPLKKEKIKLI